MSNSIGAQILSALKTRLETIQTSAGYDVSIKQVRVNESFPTLSAPAMDLPAIEIHDDFEEYQHQASSSYIALTNVLLYLVAEKSSSDASMQDFMSSVRKALFGASANASGNTGVTLGGTVIDLELVGAASDMNMIESNRVYIMRIRLRSHRRTYSD
jgi:hypothetical protein